MTDPRSDSGPSDDARTSLVEEFLATPNWLARVEFADTHPDLRDIGIITRLMSDGIQANRQGNRSEAEMLGASAFVLTGNLGRPEAAALIYDLVRARRGFELGQSFSSTVLTKVVETARNAASISEKCHSLIKGQVLDTAAVVIAQAGRYTNNPQLLGEAVTVERHAVDAPLSRSRERLGYLFNLAAFLDELFVATGNQVHLDEAVELARQVVDADPKTSTELPVLLTNLARHLAQRYEATNEAAYLEKAIEVAHQMVDITPSTSPELPALLSGLAGYLAERYEATDEAGSLEEALGPARQALSATSGSSAERGRALTNLASPFPSLVAATGDLANLQEAVAVARQAVAAAAANSSERSIALNDLAFYLYTLYSATGDRSVLDEATKLLREAVSATTISESEWIGVMHNLAVSLWDQFKASDDPAYLIEAVLVAGQAVGATPEASNELPRRLDILSCCLRELYIVNHERLFLDASVELARQAVGATSTISPTRPGLLHDLGNRLADRWEATNELTDLDEAIQVAREAINATPKTSNVRSLVVTKLARYLAEKYRATGERAYLRHALDLLPLSPGRGPADRVLLNRARADLARLNDDVAAATAALKDASAAFAAEHERLRGDLIGLRDLAGQTEGLVGDTACCHVLARHQEDALEVVEGLRTWLPTPPRAATPPRPVPVVWVVTSSWETVVLSTHLETPVVLDFDRNTIADHLNMTFVAMRRGEPHQAVEKLCELTTRITAVFPSVEEVLIVPVGACALLPYAAGRTANGDHLIDHTVVTLVPSLAWAQAAHRPRPTGASLGVFHPGQPRLNLVEDRQVFQAAFPSTTPLDSPHSADVLHLLGPDTAVAHFSCHGLYNHLRPLSSALVLADDLTLESVLKHGQASWLMNLSACETGIPDLSRAEQSISFPTGFLRGGAAHVIATLWPVGNDHATEYNRRFYQLLQAGEQPAVAHQTTINALRGLTISHDRARATTADFDTDLAFDHPYRWAAFTHHGSPW